VQQQKARSLRHGAEVCADVERICDQAQQHDALQQPVLVVLAEVSGDTLSGDSSDTRADVMDDDHEGVGEQHRPGN